MTLLQESQGPPCFEELAEFTALDFLGADKLRRGSVQPEAQRRHPLAWEGKGWPHRAKWYDGRERPKAGEVPGLQGRQAAVGPASVKPGHAPPRARPI